MSVSRRALLQGLIASAALARSGVARAQTRVLPAPDFTRPHTTPHLVGVRPFRKGGVRLELTAPLGGKPIVHNYGHAGGGITLSFGCAEEAADLIGQAIYGLGDAAPSVAVLGTGVIGLTTAQAIHRRLKLPITVYAKDLDLLHTTSAVAGGQFEPSGVWRQQTDPHARARLESWLRRARGRIRDLYPEWSKYGIAERDNYTLGHGTGGFDEGVPHDVIPAAAVLSALPFDRLTAPGRVYKTWLLDPPRLLPALKADLEARGVRFEQRLFTTPEDVAKLPETLVVNCTGFGSKQLFGDEEMIAQRGHLVRLDRPSDAHDYFFGGGCANRVNCYVFCRHDDIVIGGTVVADDERATIEEEDMPVFGRLLSNASHVFAGKPEQCTR